MEQYRSVEDVGGHGNEGDGVKQQPAQDLLRHCKSTALTGEKPSLILQTLNVKWRNLE